MKIYRLISYFFAFLALFQPVVVTLGYLFIPPFFSDHTDYGRAQDILQQIYILPNFALGVYFIYLGWTASKQRSNKKLAVSVFIFVIMMIIQVMISNYLYLHLDHGQGG